MIEDEAISKDEITKFNRELDKYIDSFTKSYNRALFQKIYLIVPCLVFSGLIFLYDLYTNNNGVYLMALLLACNAINFIFNRFAMNRYRLFIEYCRKLKTS